MERERFFFYMENAGISDERGGSGQDIRRLKTPPTLWGASGNSS
jgi:hypothetical protein